MPNIFYEIPDTYSAITRPVTVEVAKEVAAVMGLPEDTILEYFGAAETQAQIGSTLTKTTEQNKFPFKGRLALEISEQYVEDRTLTTAVKRPDAKPYFLDAALDVVLRPIYVGTEVTMSFRYRAPDRVTAERWRDEFHLRTSDGRKELLHEVRYHYGIPKSFQVILAEIYRLRENVAPYGENLKTWMCEHLSPKVTTLVTQAGTNPILAVAETQVGIVGWFEILSVPDAGSKTEASAWEVGFDYHFIYDKVVATHMTYPLVIHNQVLGPKYRPTEPLYRLQDRMRYPALQRHLLDFFTSLYPGESSQLSGVRMPDWDDWLPKYLPPATSSVITTLMGVTLTNPKELINLNELDDYAFSPVILEFLKGEAPFMSELYQSVFHISLFKWYLPIDDNSIVVDPDTLAVTSIKDLNPRDLHHVRVALVNDLTRLSPAALERLRENGAAALEIIRVLMPNLSDSEWATLTGTLGGKLWDLSLVLLGDKWLTRKDLQNLIDMINRYSTRYRGSMERRLKTVGQYLITAAHKDTLNGNS